MRRNLLMSVPTFVFVLLILPCISIAQTGEIDLVLLTETESDIYNLVALKVDEPEADTIQLTDLEDGETVTEFDVSPDGSWLAYISEGTDVPPDRHVSILDLNTLETTGIFDCEYSCIDPHFLSNSTHVLISDGAVHEQHVMFDISSDLPQIYTYQAGRGWFRWVGYDQYIIWTPGGVVYICRLEFGVDASCNTVGSDSPLWRQFGPAFTQDGERFAFIDLFTVDDDGMGYQPYFVGDVATQQVTQEFRRYETTGIPRQIARDDLIWHPDGVRFVLKIEERQNPGVFGLQLFDTETEEEITLLSDIEQDIMVVRWSLDGEWLAIILESEDDQESVWDSRVADRVWVYDMKWGTVIEFDMIVQDVHWVR